MERENANSTVWRKYCVEKIVLPMGGTTITIGDIVHLADEY